MWKKASSYALLCAALVASAAAQNAAGSSGTTAGGDVLITMPIQVDGSFKDLQLLRGESIEDAAVSFARNHGLLANSDATRVRAVVDQLSGMLRGRIAEMQATETATAAAPAPAPAPPTPVVQLSMPLTINQVTRDFKKFEGETVETAVERFLYDGDFTMGAMRELFPQVVDIVLAKLEQLQPARKELFSFSLTIDGREATARHFENGDPMEEARETFRGVGITDAAYIEQLAPQIANAINQRIAEMRPAEQPVAPLAQPATPATPAKELFSLPLTANERATVLVHYEGYTSRESAVRYLNDNGLATSPNADNMLAQLVAIIDNRIVELAQERAAQEAAARAQAEAEEAARVAAAAAQQQQQRQPLVRLPIDLGNNQAATLEYFEGDSVERTVEVFLTQIGMQEGPMFTQNAAQLADAIRQQLPAPPAEQPQEAPQEQQQPPAVEPYVQLPVTLGGRVFDLLYFQGEQPATTANTFCVEKYEIIRAEMGMQFDGDQLLECKNLLEKTLHNLIAQKQQQTQTETQTQTPPQEEPAEPAPVEATQPEPVAAPQESVAQPTTPRSPGDFLLSLDIMINGKNEPFDVYVNDDPEQLARAFCETHKLGFENVGPIVEAVKEQIANLK